MSFIHFRAARLLFPAIVVALMNMMGCTRTDVKINDNSSTLVSGTVVKRLESLKFGSRIPTQGGIEVGYEYQSGTGAQWLYPGQYVTYDQSNSNSLRSSSALNPNLTITGPQTIKSTASVDHGHVAYNHLIKFSPSFELEPSIGLSYDKANIKVLGETDGKEIELSPHALGLTISIMPRWKFNEWVSLDARLRYGVSGDGDYTTLFNPSLTLNISNAVFLSGGYIERRQYFKTENASDNYLHFSGPSAAIKIEF